MKIKRIFLDMDDVLNLFTMYALEYVGCPVNLHDSSSYDPAWGMDIALAASNLHPTKTFTQEEFWSCTDRNLWATVPKSNECNWLLEACADVVGKPNVCILTSPIRDPECLAGKLEWIQMYLPEWTHRQFLVGPPKHLCAQPASLLIDDSDANVRRFREFGGKAILFPRPWNSLHFTTVEPFLVKETIGSIGN